MQIVSSTRTAVWRWLAVLALMVAPTIRGDQLVLNDGTVLEGTVLSQGEKYWVKKADGTSQIVPKGDVKKLVTGAAAAGTSTTPGGATAAPSSLGMADFAATKSKAERVEVAMAAVTIWQKFLDSKPPAADVTAGKSELDKWQKM